ncbi:MAG: hypothetical protein ACOCYC_04535, partial [bacterium]
MSNSQDRDHWQDTKAFLDSSPTAFHAGAAISRRLAEAGFEELHEGDRWELSAGKCYFLRRAFGAVAAVRMGSAPPGDAGSVVAAAHTDSPALKLKSESERVVDGLVTVATEVYGGAIIGTWFDRDLEIAGAATVSTDTAGATTATSATETRLVRLTNLTAVVPNVAIHLNRKVNEGFQYNKQDHLRCILGAPRTEGAAAPENAAADNAADTAESSILRAAVAEHLGVAAEAILG